MSNIVQFSHFAKINKHQKTETSEMNIFILDTEKEKSVRYMVDAHIRKMPLEHAQLMSTTYRISKFLGYIPRNLTSEEIKVLKETNEIDLYVDNLLVNRATHYNHPCAVWARTSFNNYEYLADLNFQIEKERRIRFNSEKEHRSVSLSNALADTTVKELPYIGLTKFVQAMPSDTRDRITTRAYRKYYLKYKSHLFKWTNRKEPTWVTKALMKERFQCSQKLMQ